MARLGRTDGDFCCVMIPDFTDEHDVRVVAQHRTQTGGECQTDLFTHLDLNSTFELVLDGIFKGDDLTIFGVGLSQSSIKGSGFAAAGGTGEKDEALRQLSELSEESLLVWLHSQLTEIKKK